MTPARTKEQARRGSGIAGGAGGRRLLVLWDGRWWPGRMLAGLPAFDFRCAPAGLLTRRPLRAGGLAPGGHEPYARLVLRRERRWAWLY